MPNFKNILEKDDYSGLLLHIEEIDRKSKNKSEKKYGKHIQLIESLLKEAREKDLIKFSNQLKRIKIKNTDSDKAKNFLDFVEDVFHRRSFIFILIIGFLVLIYFKIIDEKLLDFIKKCLDLFT